MLIKNFYKSLSRLAHEVWAVLFPASYAKYYYKKALGKRLNLKNPKDFNEKIQWLKVYSDTTQWTRLADKYKVREYLKELGLEDILVKLYGAWENAFEIDFDKLPEKFVLKTNNGYGKNILVHNKSNLDFEETKVKLNKWVNEKQGLISFEPHYWNIPRKIIAEELLQDFSSAQISSSLIDYKFWCIHGEPDIIMVIYDRKYTCSQSTKKNKKPSMRASVFDLDWNLRNDILSGPLSKEKQMFLPKPKMFDEMIRICKILSKPFVQVRVDLYEVNGKIYFGELTFTPGGGSDYFTPEYFIKMGEKMDLSKAKRRKKRFIV